MHLLRRWLCDPKRTAAAGVDTGNPCISQQELADKAGITRSSAAVHISNLMRKGYIAGRGYLLREAPYIAVVGGVNMDIGAVSDAPLVARDSNPAG